MYKPKVETSKVVSVVLMILMGIMALGAAIGELGAASEPANPSPQWSSMGGIILGALAIGFLTAAFFVATRRRRL